jgi:hypothetical protein
MAPFASKQQLVPLRGPEYTTGRPSLYRPEYCDLVIQQAQQYGISVSAFAGVVGVSVDTVFEWRSRHREFSEACSRAKAARLLWWELKLGRSKKGAETTASVFALTNIAPDQWRSQKHTEHSHTVKAEMLSDRELNAIAAGAGPGEQGAGPEIEGEFTRDRG